MDASIHFHCCDARCEDFAPNVELITGSNVPDFLALYLDGRKDYTLMLTYERLVQLRDALDVAAKRYEWLAEVAA